MGAHRDQAATSLGRAEKDLQQFLSAAATAGDFSAASDLVRALDHLAKAKTLVGTNGVNNGAGPPSVNKTSQKFSFFRDTKDQLVKVGRQRKGAGEYDHRCPKAELDNIMNALLTSTKTPMTAQDLASQVSAPYKIHVCLGWLVQAGLVRKRGHQGYEVVSRQTFKTDVAANWSQLPTM